MNGSILVTYATATGSTVDVTATIGETLGAQGLAVDVKPIVDTPRIDGESGYSAVVIGSAVQYGTWLPEAIEFVQANQSALANVPVALFSVHIRNQGDDGESRRNRLAYLDEVRPLVQAVDEGYFAGKFDRSGAEIMLPSLVARLVPPLDFRKWDKIRAWAESVGPRLS
jgi:menaquinone-dependent protoporphyrinogen oxidase